jgi:two-component system KDP operon response regulator KdpE
VLLRGEEVRLSPTEWALIEVLVRNRGKLVSRHQLEQDPAHPRHIITQPGMGYIFEAT